MKKNIIKKNENRKWKFKKNVKDMKRENGNEKKIKKKRENVKTK